MRICSNIKNEIWMLEIEGRDEDVIRKLQKIKMIATEYDSVETELFVNHSMAKSYSKKGDKHFANYYLNCNKEIFDNKEVFEDRRLEYYKYLWLYSEVNKDDISKEEYYKNFMEIYRYYNEINDYRFSDKAIKNIILSDNKKEEVISFFKSIINEYGKDDKMIKDMVASCKKLDNQVYITLEKILYDNDGDIAM